MKKLLIQLKQLLFIMMEKIVIVAVIVELNLLIMLQQWHIGNLLDMIVAL